MTQADKLKNILNTFEEVEFAYLFGSFTSGEFNERSDIDVAVYLKKDLNFFDTKLAIHHQLEIDLQRDIDLIVLNQIKNFDLLKDILDKGVLLKDSANDVRVMFELDKHHEILDYKAFQRMIDVA